MIITLTVINVQRMHFQYYECRTPTATMINYLQIKYTNLPKLFTSEIRRFILSSRDRGIRVVLVVIDGMKLRGWRRRTLLDGFGSLYAYCIAGCRNYNTAEYRTELHVIPIAAILRRWN